MKRRIAGQIKKGAFRLFYPLLAICLTATIICSYGLLREHNMWRQGWTFYSTLSSGARNDLETTDEMSHGEDQDSAESGNHVQTTTGVTFNEDSGSSKSTWTSYVDFQAIRETIPGLVAWIECGGTTIGYPIVQGTDNEYYLSHLPDGTKNKMGSIFLDYRSSPDFSDKNSIIHGHNMKNGEMLGALCNYKTQAFYDEYPTIAIHTPENDYTVELFTGYLVNAAKETLPLDFENEADFERYVTEIRQRSVFGCDVDVIAGDRLVTLSTCTYEFTNARFVLVGKLMED